MSTTIFWFRHDLRLHDQLALHRALAQQASHLLPVVCLPDFEEKSHWGFPRFGAWRRYWYLSAVADLSQQLAALNCPLLICPLKAVKALPQLAALLGSVDLVCEEIAAPEEQAELQLLRDNGLQIQSVWQSSLIDPHSLPWQTQELSAVFTQFRQQLEQRQIQPPKPLAAPTHLPPWPSVIVPAHLQIKLDALSMSQPAFDERSSMPLSDHAIDGGERAGLGHLRRYLAARLPHTYKQTRNQLMGQHYSSKWSPWLATGALSARQIFAELQQFEAEYGANDGSYWLWFELLWRDYFRFLHLQYGAKLYRARGLLQAPPQVSNQHDSKAFDLWREGETGEPLIDAAMRELRCTGYLSNRLRQVVASYLIYQLHGDWRAGAAWFESQLIDFDIYSNQGNWLYIAGRGTDPRGGRIFNVQKQVHDHDRDGVYRQRWAR